MDTQLQITLAQAIQAFQDGNLSVADSILRRILQVDSKNLPALHILGLIRASQGSYKEASVLLERAARINPNDASIQYNLAKALSDSGNDKDALAHHKKAVNLAPNNPEAWLSYGKSVSNLGRHEDALVCYENALRLEPDYVEAILNKGATLKQLNRYEEAISFAEMALVINPQLAEAWLNKGVALKELKRFEEAIIHYDEALNLKPDYHEAWSNKGVALQELKRFEEAIIHYDEALNLKPDYHEAWSNKGVAMQELKRFEEAIICLDKAISIKSDDHKAWSNKGGVLKDLKRFEEAIIHYDKAISLKPSYHLAWSNKGVSLQELQRFEEAIIHFDKAINLKSDFAEAWFNKALIDLLLKKYDSGWKNYDWRLKTKYHPLNKAIENLELWDGSYCNELLIFSEQGIGDIIFFASLFRAVSNRAKNITVLTDSRLVPILSRSFPVITFIDKSTALDASLYDAQIPLASLSVILNMQPNMSGRGVPYLIDESALTKSINNKFENKNLIKCGVAWKSNNLKMGKDKSILLSDLNPIFEIKDYEFINLQYGDVEEEIKSLENTFGFQLKSVEGVDLFENIEGLLSIIKTCDVVVTTSNVTAHLSGALGKPTFLLAPYSAGRIWYWHNEEISSWYPSISIYSQNQNFDWNEAIMNIASRLKNESVE